MKLSIGIVGLPNVGKSTLFKILTKQEVNIANYPFATIDPNVGVVPVPDERLEKLAKLSNSKKIIPAVVEFYDIAGLVRGANKGEGLGNQFLSHIRETKAIVHIVRCFGQNDIVHVDGNVNPIRDIETIESELILKDLETVERSFIKAESEAKNGKKETVEFRDGLKKIKERLERNELLFNDNTLIHKNNSLLIIKELNLLTAKPQLFLLNGDPQDVNEKIKEKIKSLGADYIIFNLMSSQNVNILIKKAYEVLNLISFLTTGEDETRAWTIEKGTIAAVAAGVIHSDFEKKFIRAEVINWQKLLEAGGWNQAKQKGWLRLEGKNYTVQDGDVMVIRHS